MDSRAGPYPKGRIHLCSMSLYAATVTALVSSVVGASPVGAEPLTSAEPTKTFVLFEPGAGTPAAVSASVREEIEHDYFQREFLFSRWVRFNDVDSTSARSGDRVIFAVSDGESIELELTSVTILDRSTIWHGRFPNTPGSTMFALFSRPEHSLRKPMLTKAGLTIPLQRRSIEVFTVEELPGWGLLREAKPGTGTHRDLGDDTGGPAWRKYIRERAEELRRQETRLSGSCACGAAYHDRGDFADVSGSAGARHPGPGVQKNVRGRLTSESVDKLVYAMEELQESGSFGCGSTQAPTKRHACARCRP